MKQYILIRTDIKVPIGKIIAHAGHNVLKIWDDVFLTYNDWDERLEDMAKWYGKEDQTKIVVNGGTEKDIQKIIDRAYRQGIPYSFLKDIKLNKRICAVIGPVSKIEAEFLGLSKLPLYK